MGSLGAKQNASTPRLEDEFEGWFGERSQSPYEDRLSEAMHLDAINPNYGQKGYDNNCALCTTAFALYVRGYDVEAMPRDTRWRGFERVFDVDWSNPDNYILGDGVVSIDEESYPEIKNVFSSTGGVTQKYINLDKFGADGRRERLYNPPIMPKGPQQAAKAIEDKVKSWGNGAVGQMTVKWKNTSGAHEVNIINQNGKPLIYDPQTGKSSDDIAKYLSRTRAVNTRLVRLDNAPLKHQTKNLTISSAGGITQEWNKMFKRKEKR